jgi:hypothetical protein
MVFLILANPPLPRVREDWVRCNIFFTRCKANEKVYDAIIDNDL